MLVGLLGMGAAWREGALWAVLTGVAAEVAILLPSTLLVVVVCLGWSRFRHSLGGWPLSAPWGPSPWGCSLRWE